MCDIKNLNSYFLSVENTTSNNDTEIIYARLLRNSHLDICFCAWHPSNLNMHGHVPLQTESDYWFIIAHLSGWWIASVSVRGLSLLDLGILMIDLWSSCVQGRCAVTKLLCPPPRMELRFYKGI